MNLLTLLTEKTPLPIYVSESIKRLPQLLKLHNFDGRILIITDKKVASLYLKSIRHMLIRSDYNVKEFIIKGGEDSKDIETVKKIWIILNELDFNKKDVVLALGGGVVSDVTGFSVFTFKRGIPLLHIPTTLLAQIDASIGGKNAINFNGVKNLIGGFYQPRLTIIDLKFLDTLSKREFRNGLGEVVKYGMIMPTNFFSYLEKEVNPVNLKSEILKYIIWRCTQYKVDIVNRDERDTGIRRILNFGHTVGHAIEAYFNYSKYSHGEAISIGMLVEAYVSVLMNKLNISDYERLKNVLKRFSLPIFIDESINIKKMFDIMLSDKKNSGSYISMMLPIAIGIIEEFKIKDFSIVYDAMKKHIVRIK